MAIARYYDESKNKDGAHFPGVGLRDLTQEEWDAIPAGIQADVDASGFYRKTKPQQSADKPKEAVEAPKEAPPVGPAGSSVSEGSISAAASAPAPAGNGGGK